MEIPSVRAVVLLMTILFLWNTSFCQAHEIEGKITLAPPWPQAIQLEVTKDPENCGPTQASQTLLVSEQGGVENAVISIEGESYVWIERLTIEEMIEHRILPRPFLNQKNCRFEPHVLIVPVNYPLPIGNSDSVVHDVRAFEPSKMIFRFEMDAGQSPVEQVFSQPGRYVIRCGFHPWMHAFVIATDGPEYYAVSDRDGHFRLAVPDGQWTLKIWHERLGDVEIPLGEVKESIKDFSYTFPALE